MTEQSLSPTDPSSAPNPLRPRPLFGLPKSLLRQEGKTIALFAMLRKSGLLNRDMKRRLAESSEQQDDLAAELVLGELPVSLSDTDRRLLRRWANPVARMVRYWAAMNPPRRGPLQFNAWDYVTAIDLLWFDAFAGDWKSLSLDETPLTTHCPAWPQIRTYLEKNMASTGVKLDFGVFMLWPRILGELADWAALDEERRMIVGRAVVGTR